MCLSTGSMLRGRMKQVTQRMRDGRIEVLEVPAPVLTPDGVLVDVRASLLSAGTERVKVQAGRQSLIGKARSRPDQVAQVLDKVRRDGLRDALEAVRRRLDQPGAIGYSAAGVVLAVGERVRDVSPGDRVAMRRRRPRGARRDRPRPGQPVAPLAPRLAFEHGAFATVGSIAMHGVRQADCVSASASL